jgi:hypothetical protein
VSPRIRRLQRSEAVQSRAPPGTEWTRAPWWRDDARMPLDLTDLELEAAARACRAEEQAAKRIENPGMRGPIENTAKRAAALAEKFEACRNSRR